MLFIRARVAPNEMQRCDRYVKLRIAGIAEGQELFSIVVDGQGLQT